MNHKHLFLCIIFLPVICSGSNLSPAGNYKQGDTTIRTTTGSSGLYYEISMRDTMPNYPMEGIMKIYLDPSGNIRIISQTTFAKSDKTTTNQLTLKDDHLHTYLIDVKNKEYTFHTIYRGPSPLEDKKTLPVITKVGSETVNGFPCTLLNIASPKDSSKVWISDSIPGFKRLANALYITMALGGGDNNNNNNILSKKGYKGFWVRYEITGGPMKGMTMKLTKAEHKNIPASFMKIPADYKKLSAYDYAMKHHQ